MNKNFIVISIFIISSFLFFLYVYKAYFIHNGDKNYYYNIFNIFCLGIILFLSTLNFILPKNLSLIFNISFISLFITLYIFETSLTVKEATKFNRAYKIYEENNKNKYDKRDKIEVYKKLKKIDINHVVNIGTYLFRDLSEKNNFFPFSGIANQNTLHCNENGYYSIYKSDRYGFNNPDYEWDEKNIKYLVVGDSYVHGNCVNRPNDITSVLRDLSKKSALNLGYDGHRGPLIYYATLREYYRSNVENILFVYYEGNDLSDLKNELDSKILNKYLNDFNFSQDLVNKQYNIDKIAYEILNNEVKKEEVKKRKEKKINLIQFLKLNKTRNILMGAFGIDFNLKVPHHENPLLLSKLSIILEKTKDFAIKNNSNLYFIYLPQFSNFKKNHNIILTDEYFKIKNMVDKLNIPFINIIEIFQKSKNPLKFFPFEMGMGHYNEKGYREVSKYIYEFIDKK